MVTFNYSDYSAMISPSVASGVFTIVQTWSSGTLQTDTGKTKSTGTNFTYSSQTIPYVQAGGSVQDTNITYIQTNAGTNKIVQMLPYTLPSIIGTPTYFLIYANNTTTGTGNITCSASYDGGTTFTNSALNTIAPITSTQGTNLVYKLNLNAGASNGTATADTVGIISFNV